MNFVLMKKIYLLLILLFSFLHFVSSQELAIIARPAKSDSIMLRYAPVNKEIWKLGNTYGYVIERYTVLRSGAFLPDHEYRLLTPVPLKPQSLDIWEQYEDIDKYVAIAAECIFGESSVPLISAVAIAQRYKEEENKFSFALYAADQSPLVARLSGLSFTDNTVRRDEKYLYSVRIAAPDSIVTDTSFIFMSCSEYSPLPKPLNVSAEWSDRQVRLSWDILSLEHIYNSYKVERSTDGKNYTAISDNAVVQSADEDVTPERAYRTDTFPDNTTVYYYRVRGVNAFGEISEASDSVFGRGRLEINQSPVILNKQPIANKQVKLDWEYPQKLNAFITGFRVYRAVSPQGEKKKIYEGKKPQERSFTDNNPDLTNYYIVSVYAGNTEKFSSGFSYVGLIDSTPPAAPTGLSGEVDTLGTVHIRWLPNRDNDIKGYRVFRGNRPDYEFINIHPSVLTDTQYIDTINIKTLTKEVYYKIKAIDDRENQSAFSDILELSRPDIIPPVSPVIKDIRAEKSGITITWYNSSSEDVVLHRIYRKDEFSDSAVEICVINYGVTKADVPVGAKTGTCTDKNITSGETYIYQIAAEDDSKLLSPMSSPVQAKAHGEIKVQELFLKAKTNSNEEVILSWTVGNKKAVEKVIIYKSINDGQLQPAGSTSESSFTDRIFIDFGTIVKYRIKAIYKDGTSSDFSKEVKVVF